MMRLMLSTFEPKEEEMALSARPCFAAFKLWRVSECEIKKKKKN
jgi:hypothetical protein